MRLIRFQFRLALNDKLVQIVRIRTIRTASVGTEFDIWPIPFLHDFNGKETSL